MAIRILIILLATMLSGCAGIGNLYEKVKEGKPSVNISISDLESGSKRLENVGRTLVLKGRYKGIHQEITSWKGQIVKDAFFKVCDKSGCSNRFYLLGTQRSLLDSVKNNQYIQIKGTLASTSGNSKSATLLGNSNTLGLGVGQNSDYDKFWVLAIQPPTTGYSDSKSVPDGTVKIVQTTLKSLGYNVGTVDGLWGPNTSSALQAFQVDNNLHYSGELDEKTHELIKIEYEKIKSP